MGLIKRLISAVSFREIDRKTIGLNKMQGQLTFRLRQNDETGSQYVIFDYGAEAPLVLDRDKLDKLIEAALQIRKQMT